MRDSRENIKDHLEHLQIIRNKLHEIPCVESNEFIGKLMKLRGENEKLKFDNAYFEKVTEDVVKKLEQSEETADKLLTFQEKMKENFFDNEAAGKEIEEKLEAIVDPQFKNLLEQQLTIVKTT